MKLSAQLIASLKFTLLTVILALLVLISYSLETKIIRNIRNAKATQRAGHLQMNLSNSFNDVCYQE